MSRSLDSLYGTCRLHPTQRSGTASHPEVLLVEKPVVRDNVADVASAMAQRRRDFDLLRGRCCKNTPCNAELTIHQNALDFSIFQHHSRILHWCSFPGHCTDFFHRCPESRGCRGLQHVSKQMFRSIPVLNQMNLERQVPGLSLNTEVMSEGGRRRCCAAVLA